MTDQNKSTDERNALITAVLDKRCEPPHPRCMTCVAWAMSDELERLERALTETHDAWTAETTKRLQAVRERDCAVEDVARLIAENKALRDDAVETVQHWGGYVSDYFREKHDLAGDIERLRGADDVGAHCAHGIPINSPSACPSCHTQQPTRSGDA